MTTRRLVAVLWVLVLTAGCTSTVHRIASEVGPSPAPTADPNQLAAPKRARHLLDLLRPGPGWVPVTSVPTPALMHETSVPASPDLVVATRFWTAPGPWAVADAWIAGHPPTGLTRGAIGSVGDRTGPVSRSVGYQAGSRATALVITTAPAPGGRVGVRVDAQVIWRPARRA